MGSKISRLQFTNKHTQKTMQKILGKLEWKQ